MIGGDNKKDNGYFPLKYIVVFLAMVMSMLLLTTQAYAFTVYESSGSAIKKHIYYNASQDLYFVDFYTWTVDSVWFASYGNDDTFTTIQTEKTRVAGDYGWAYLSGFYFDCNVNYRAIFYDADGREVGRVKFKATELVSPSCDSNIDGAELGPPVDGSCGCIFNNPSWREYMDKVDDVIAAIPPPPNWQQVANTMRDTIVPRMIDDLGNMLGTAPPPPAPPPNMNLSPIAPPPDEPVNDYANDLKQKEPTMNDNTELEESVYSSDDILNEAPEIEFNEDPTGGFNIMNPIEALPPTTNMPMPGESAGEWDHQPEQQIEMDAPIPQGGGDVELGDPPIPNQPNNEAPLPDQNYMPPPMPGGEQVDMGNYKPHPDAPDGSG